MAAIWEGALKKKERPRAPRHWPMKARTTVALMKERSQAPTEVQTTPIVKEVVREWSSIT